MTPDPKNVKALAEAKSDENFRFRQFLKMHPRLSSEEIDGLMQKISLEVLSTIDCTLCGNCCAQVSPMLSQEEVARLARRLQLSEPEFTDKYLQQSEVGYEEPWIMRDCPCPFYKDNICSVYEYRPQTCRDFPYLSKPDLAARWLSMIGRLSVCPAAYQSWERLKLSTGFSRRRAQIF